MTLQQLLLSIRFSVDSEMLADELYDYGREEEARILREEPSFCIAYISDAVYSASDMPASMPVHVLTARCQRDEYYSKRCRRSIVATRWYVNNVMVGRSGTQAARVARRISRFPLYRGPMNLSTRAAQCIRKALP